MSHIIPFTQLTKADIALAGGKGANLGELARAGLPVPAGFVLTTAAYDAFVRTHALAEKVVTLAGAVSATEPASSETASRQIRELFLEAAIPADLAAAITGAYNELITEEAAAVAVRSSATAEDLPQASFAGQQDTFLNVQGETALLEAVRACWASLWTARAIVYRLRQGIDPAGVSLAVVVQRLVAADVAGILFTANPVNGRRDEILINATWGLGEAIVGGLVTPDTVVIDKESGEISDRETATKTLMTVRTETGTTERAVPEAQQSQPALDAATAQKLAGLALKIEAHYAMPMDIEWAVAAGEIAILQARPITSLPEPKPEPPDVSWDPPAPETIWMRRQIVEHMPAPLSPLFADLYLKKGMDQTLAELMEAMNEMGGASFDLYAMMPHGFAATINGYAYTSGNFDMSARVMWDVLKIYARIYRFFRHSAFDYEGTVLPAYQGLIARWGALDLNEADDQALLQGIAEMAAADSGYWFGSALNLGLSRSLDSGFDRLLRSFLIRSALPEPRPVSASFLRGFDSKALDAQADMEAIADAIRTSASLRGLVANSSAADLLAALANHPEGQPVLAEIQRYLDLYGHQIYNLDFVDPTQNEDPLPLLLSLKALVEAPPQQAVRDRQAKMAADREALVDQTIKALNPLSRWLFRLAWKWTKKYAPYREEVMFYMGAAWPTLRRLAFELGRRLTASGAIARPGDIYYLQSDEIGAVLAARATGATAPSFISLAQERRRLREARQLLAPPAKVPEGATLKFGPFNLSMFDPTPGGTDEDGPILNGYAVSTGRVTALASVIQSVEDFDQMRPGTVLVCTTTTPAWTPLFSQAVGLVTDIGGALAHGSIVAREYGIPAVMGTGVATDRIKSGMMLVVDGDAGTVTLMDDAIVPNEKMTG